MLLLFLILQSGDSLNTDTTDVTPDTAEILLTYEIPEITQYDHKDKIMQEALLCSRDIVPDLTCITLGNLFFYSPFTVIDLGPALPQHLIQDGFDPTHTFMFFNNHLINDPITGTVDLHLVPIQFLQSINIGKNGFGVPSININGKKNIYDRPYSSTGFMTGSFGHTAYMFELTRAIDNDLGFYLDGLYNKADGYRFNDHFSTMALYINAYDNHIIPMRFDALVTSRTFGFPDTLPDTLSFTDRRLIDISYTTGIKDHNAFLFYQDYTNDWNDSLNQQTIEQASRTYGIGSDNFHRMGPVQFMYTITGVRHDITSDIYGSHEVYTLSAAQTINGVFGSIFASASMQEEIDSNGFHYAPFASMGMRFLDTAVIYASVTRRYRKPLISETAVLIDTIHNVIRTNDSLHAAYYWRGDVGVCTPFGSITLFHYDYDDRIAVLQDSSDRLVYAHQGPWQNNGIHGSVSFPLYIRQNDEHKSFTRCTFGIYGSYLFNEDSGWVSPHYAIHGIASFTRQTDRFGVTIAAYSSHVGEHTYPLSHTQDAFTTIGCSAELRFVTLTFAARLDNILDINHAYCTAYPLPPRSFILNIQWQFWH